MIKEIVRFLEDNVDGRTLYTDELKYQLEDGALEGIYSDQISFSNLKYSQSTIQFDMFVVANEKIYSGNNLRKDFNAVSLFRFELAKRKSTNLLTGLFRFISASGKDIPAQAIVSGIYDVELSENSLTLMEDQILYRDQPIQNDKYKAIAFKSKHSFTISNDKLTYEYNGESFDVDTASLKRKKSGDAFPPFISKEK